MDRFFARLFKIAQERGELGLRRSAGAGEPGVGDSPHHRDPPATRVPRANSEAIVNGAIDVMLRSLDCCRPGAWPGPYRRGRRC
jgi:hypothetical protein